MKAGERHPFGNQLTIPTMHPKLAAALGRLNDVRHDFHQTIEVLPAALRSQRPAPDRWSVNEVIEHIARVEQLFVSSLVAAVERARTAGLPPEIDEPVMLSDELKVMVEDRTTPRTAPDHLRPTGSVDAPEGLRTIEAGHARLRDALESAGDLALSRVTHDHRIFGTLNIYQWIDFIVGHERRHLAQVREILSQVGV